MKLGYNYLLYPRLAKKELNYSSIEKENALRRRKF